MRAVFTGALLLCLSARAVWAGDPPSKGNGGQGESFASEAKAACIKTPDAPPNPAGDDRLPGQAFRSEPLDEEEMGQALGPVGIAAGSILLLGAMLWLLASGHSSLGILDPNDEPDSTYGLRPGH